LLLKLVMEPYESNVASVLQDVEGNPEAYTCDVARLMAAKPDRECLVLDRTILLKCTLTGTCSSGVDSSGYTPGKWHFDLSKFDGGRYGETVMVKGCRPCRDRKKELDLKGKEKRSVYGISADSRRALAAHSDSTDVEDGGLGRSSATQWIRP
jgi:hypothetical protein